MKRIMLLTGILLIAAQITEAQNNVLFIRIGGSQFTGVAGAEIQVGHFGLEGGWAGLNHPDLSEPWSMGGIALSVYSGKPFENSFYGSIGYSVNGVIKMTVDESVSIIQTEYADSKAIMVGYKWGGTAWFSLKGGLGYQLSELGNTITGEISIGIALLAF